ncbi:uncharacterized protein C8Q71DRAFT_188731 [Rhodofomes roseus]|uniref:F-box domain-containing protein n=1 Tax=Rhodofomes roseus TaxID=34475 RepID=A0ABQ8K8G2_9APHY|nr:uncharacterized protein C8Q71DRAFT_188731 [Rhodofomes roseus]KAH9833536.1 hypothetical protein C8Q71DRAFT_188731 [Rhodofomes roseus]
MPPRRSKRTKPSSAAAGVTAKTEARWKNVRGRRGGLKDMLNMPMDIVQEICLYLHPHDLLNLSRTTKSFHVFLMKRSSAYLWKGSLKSVEGLPPCPKGWIEPLWISLVFSPYCTECGVGKATTVHWTFLARFCASCRKDMVVAKNKVHTILDDTQWRYFGYINSTVFLEATVTGFNALCYLQSQVFKYVDQFGKLYASGKWEEARKLANKHAQRAKLSREYAASCHKWAANEERMRIAEAESVIRERLDDIVARLRALNWGPELDFIQTRNYTPLSEHKLVRVAKRLTDRVWQNMQDEIVRSMDSIRQERLEHEHRSLLTARWPILESAGGELLHRYIGDHPELSAYGLYIADFALLKEVREVMCTPANEIVDEASFLALEGQMDTMVERWRARICKQLRGLFIKHKVKTPRGMNPLDLATTVFDLNPYGYTTVATFPSVLTYSDTVRYPCTPKSRRSTYEQFVYEQEGVDSEFTSDKIKPKEPNDHMRRVIQLCGKNPETATAKEMDALDIRLVSEPSDVVVTWLGAMLKAAAPGAHAHNWRRATADETVKTKDVESHMLAHHSIWTCTKCEASPIPASRDAVQDHLRDTHKIGLTAIVDGDIEMNVTLANAELASLHVALSRVLG